MRELFTQALHDKSLACTIRVSDQIRSAALLARIQWTVQAFHQERPSFPRNFERDR